MQDEQFLRELFVLPLFYQHIDVLFLFSQVLRGLIGLHRPQLLLPPCSLLPPYGVYETRLQLLPKDVGLFKLLELLLDIKVFLLLVSLLRDFFNRGLEDVDLHILELVDLVALPIGISPFLHPIIRLSQSELLFFIRSRRSIQPSHDTTQSMGERLREINLSINC